MLFWKWRAKAHATIGQVWDFRSWYRKSSLLGNIDISCFIVISYGIDFKNTRTKKKKLMDCITKLLGHGRIPPEADLRLRLRQVRLKGKRLDADYFSKRVCGKWNNRCSKRAGLIPLLPSACFLVLFVLSLVICQLDKLFQFVKSLVHLHTQKSIALENHYY